MSPMNADRGSLAATPPRWRWLLLLTPALVCGVEYWGLRSAWESTFGRASLVLHPFDVVFLAWAGTPPVVIAGTSIAAVLTLRSNLVVIAVGGSICALVTVTTMLSSVTNRSEIVSFAYVSLPVVQWGLLVATGALVAFMRGPSTAVRNAGAVEASSGGPAVNGTGSYLL